jgi:glycosyltransferase involved in cell wall biosynthesis
MKVMYYLRDGGACGYYRAELPMQAMSRLTGTPMARIVHGDSLDKMLGAVNADVALLPRPSDEDMYALIEVFQEHGVKCVADHDDNVFEVSPLSPHYRDYGVEDVKHQLQDGSMVDLWKDGTNYNKSANMERIDQFKRSLELVDAVSVTTDALAQVYREYNDNILVLPNCVDLDNWYKLPLKRDNKEEIKLFWQGGTSHYEDWLLLKDVLPVIFDKYPNVHLHIMGALWEGTMLACDPNRWTHHKWVPNEAYHYKVREIDPDICIIPLQDTKFNRCKSSIKWVEQAASSVPSVASHCTPYKELHDGTNGVFVENETDAWIEGISYMIDNPLERWGMGGKAKATVKRNFDINKECLRWHDAYKELIDGD